jgi:hypothetical protein
MKIRLTLPLFFAAGLAVFALDADTTPKKAESGTLLIVDAVGKEQKLKTWKFTEGVRRLGWLAEKKESSDKDKKDASKGKRETQAVGPEALVLRAETEIEFLDGVQTLVPLVNLRSIDFDAEKETMTAKVVRGDKAEDDEALVGTTKYKRINKLVIEAEVDKGDLGIAEIKYLGGYPRGMRGVRFSSPKPAPTPMGRPGLVVVADSRKKTKHKVVDLQPLYLLPDRAEKLLPTLMFKKTLKLDVSKIKKIVVGGDAATWQVTLKDGGDEALTLLETIPFEGKQARLLGFVGRVPAGYKLFPAIAIAEITFDAAEEKK